MGVTDLGEKQMEIDVKLASIGVFNDIGISLSIVLPSSSKSNTLIRLEDIQESASLIVSRFSGHKKMTANTIIRGII